MVYRAVEQDPARLERVVWLEIDDPQHAEEAAGVAGEQQHLKKQHAGGPHGRRAAEPWQRDLADQRLDLKQQEGAQEDRDGEAQHGAVGPEAPHHTV